MIIRLADGDHEGSLPAHVRERFSVAGAWGRALGWREGDSDEPSEPPNSWESNAVAAAAVGLCLGVGPTLRECRGDVVELGERVLDELVGAATDVRLIVEAGRHLIDLIYDSLPTRARIEEAADPFEGPTEPGTDDLPGSG